MRFGSVLRWLGVMVFCYCSFESLGIMHVFLPTEKEKSRRKLIFKTGGTLMVCLFFCQFGTTFKMSKITQISYQSGAIPPIFLSSFSFFLSRSFFSSLSFSLSFSFLPFSSLSLFLPFFLFPPLSFSFLFSSLFSIFLSATE